MTVLCHCEPKISELVPMFWVWQSITVSFAVSIKHAGWVSFLWCWIGLPRPPENLSLVVHFLWADSQWRAFVIASPKFRNLFRCFGCGNLVQYHLKLILQKNLQGFQNLEGLLQAKTKHAGWDCFPPKADKQSARKFVFNCNFLLADSQWRGHPLS